MNSNPLISCLCVTRNKVELISRAIDCFLAQTYPNKELIIIYEDNDNNIKNFLSKVTETTIRCYEVSTNPKLSLGELRNLSLEYSLGEYFCQWDADDWYHNQRLEYQMKAILTMHKPICFLTYWIIFDTLTNKAYLSYKRLWEGSILCSKDIVIKDNIKYPSEPRMEDNIFSKKIIKKNNVYPVDLPHLYIYVYHGDNTWEYQHFQNNFNVGIQFSEEVNLLLKNILNGMYTIEQASKILSSDKVLKEVQFRYEI